MKEIKKYITVLLAALILCFISKGSASMIRDTLHLLGSSGPVKIRIHAEIIKNPVYGEKRNEKLNKLLQHMDFEIETENSISKSTLLLDKQEMFSWIQVNHEDGESVLIAVDPEHIYRIQNNEEMQLVVPALGIDSIQRYRRIWDSLESYIEWFKQMETYFSENISESKISIRYKTFGDVVKRKILNLTSDEISEFVKNDTYSKEVVFYPETDAFVFAGKQKVSLMQREDGTTVRINYNGACGINTESIRNVSLEWRVLREEGKIIDQFQIRTPSQKGSERDNLSIERSWTETEDGNEQLTWKVETDCVKDRVRTQTKLETEVHTVNSQSAEIRIKEIRTEKGQSTINEITGTILTDNGKPSGGTLEILSKSGKIVTNNILISFDVLPMEQSKMNIHSMDQYSNGESMENIYKLLAARLVSMLITLPEEDLDFLMDGIPEEIWHSLCDIQHNE